MTALEYAEKFEAEAAKVLAYAVDLRLLAEKGLRVAVDNENRAKADLAVLQELVSLARGPQVVVGWDR